MKDKIKEQLIKESEKLKKRITELEKAEREWKKAEEELRESELQYRTALDSMGDAIHIVDNELRLILFNKAFRRWNEELGLETDVIGRTVFEAFPFLPDSVRDEYQKVFDTGEILITEESTKIAGRELITETRKIPIFQEGKVVRIITAIRDITERKRAEKVQTAIYRISEATPSVQNLEELFHSIHTIISELMPARNFYIVVYDETTEKVSFPYFVDKYDKTPAPKKLGRGMTEYVLRTGKPLLAPRKAIEDLAKKGEIEIFGTLPVCWLGVPLKILEKTIGVLVVQSYTEDVRFGEEEKDILTFVSEQVAMAIERKRAEEQRRESEEQHRKVIENICKFVPDGLLVFTDKLNLFLKNKAFQDIIQKYSAKLNYTEQELTEIIIEQVKNRIINKDYTEIRISKKQG